MIADRASCREVILQAGERLVKRADYEISEKTNFKDLVTSCDRETQEYLVEKLGNICPQASFLCEEEGMQDTSGQYRFIIDPIDGTANFINRYGHSAISVAFADKTEILWGIVYNPYSKELYEAEKGRGALLNGEPIHVNDQPLKHSLVNIGTSPYYKELKEETFRLTEILMDFCLDIRRSGSAALDLCYVAAGRCGLYYEMMLSPWDYAAGMCIVKEAGGVVTDWRQQEPDFTKKNGVVAGNPVAAQDFFDIYSQLQKPVFQD